uniref:Venom protein family 25 protein 1 n=1 Tax=Lethocerus distinctifemur TaxID=280095 RepID=A0A2K8JNG8_9HEMI|nr:venom protein family 25 protein 1 [Lethocerus distinctifemur]
MKVIALLFLFAACSNAQVMDKMARDDIIIAYPANMMAARKVVIESDEVMDRVGRNGFIINYPKSMWARAKRSPGAFFFKKSDDLDVVSYPASMLDHGDVPNQKRSVDAVPKIPVAVPVAYPPSVWHDIPGNADTRKKRSPIGGRFRDYEGFIAKLKPSAMEDF